MISAQLECCLGVEDGRLGNESEREGLYTRETFALEVEQGFGIYGNILVVRDLKEYCR